MTKPRTKPSTPRLSDAARHVVVPKGVVSTGWPSVEKKCRELGIGFRWWQKPIGQIILAKRADGKYASTVGGTGLSIPRQVGKTFLVGAIVFALCLLRPNLTVIWTAHRARTAEETFGKMQAFARRKRVKPHVEKIWLGSGEEEIRFRNGSRILFGARAREFGRGFDEVDVLIFDEAQILTDAVLDDMIPATNQSRQETSALLLFMGTPPRPKDPGEVFTRMREEALSGEDEDTGWVEFGADPDYEPTPPPAPLTEADWAQVAKANPSFPEDTPREAILRMRKKLGPDSFLREGYGIWDDPTRRRDVFGRGFWGLCRGDLPAGLPMGALAVTATMDLSKSAITAAAPDGDMMHVKPLRHGPGTGWVVERAKELQAAHDVEVSVDGRGPAAVLIPHLEQAGVRLRILSTSDVLDACAEIYTRVQDGRLRHGDYPELNTAVAGAVKRNVGKRWAWGQGASDTDITTLDGATFAAWAADKPPATVSSAYETQRLEVL
jgi:hypothetical protein